MAFSALGLWLAWRQVSVHELLDSLRQVHLVALGAGLLFLAVAMFTKVERWAWLLSPQAHLSRRALWSALLIGYMANVVLPARLGEVVRAGLVAERAAIPVSQVLSTVLVEKILDIGVILFFLLLFGLSQPLTPWARQAGLVSGAVFVGLITALLAAVLAGERLLIWLERRRSRLPNRLATGPWWQWLASFVAGFAPLRSPSVAVRVIAYSLLGWVAGGLVNLAVLWGFGIEPLLPSAVLTLVTTNLGMALPSAPGYIGVHHYLSVLALSAFAVPHSQALAYAIAIHALLFGSFAMSGSIALLTTGLRFRALRFRLTDLSR